MNERIKELLQDPIDYADKTNTYTHEEGFNIQVWDKIRIEKLVELIQQDCLQHLTNTGQDHAREVLEKYFAIK